MICIKSFHVSIIFFHRKWALCRNKKQHLTSCSRHRRLRLFFSSAWQDRMCVCVCLRMCLCVCVGGWVTEMRTGRRMHAHLAHFAPCKESKKWSTCMTLVCYEPYNMPSCRPVVHCNIYVSNC